MDKQPPRSELMKLARLEPDRQAECAAQFLSSEIKSVNTYLKQGEPETAGTDTPSSFDSFMESSSLILNEFERLSSLLAASPDFTDEQTETARIQANKPREAADRLTAQLEGRR